MTFSRLICFWYEISPASLLSNELFNHSVFNFWKKCKFLTKIIIHKTTNNWKSILQIIYLHQRRRLSSTSQVNWIVFKVESIALDWAEILPRPFVWNAFHGVPFFSAGFCCYTCCRVVIYLCDILWGHGSPGSRRTLFDHGHCKDDVACRWQFLKWQMTKNADGAAKAGIAKHFPKDGQQGRHLHCSSFGALYNQNRRPFSPLKPLGAGEWLSDKRNDWGARQLDGFLH